MALLAQGPGYPQGAGVPVALKAGRRPNSLAGLPAEPRLRSMACEAWAMGPRRENRVCGFSTGNARSPRRGADQAHDARARAPIHNPAFARRDSSPSGLRLLNCAECGGFRGLRKPEYHKYDRSFFFFFPRGASKQPWPLQPSFSSLLSCCRGSLSVLTESPLFVLLMIQICHHPVIRAIELLRRRQPFPMRSCLGRQARGVLLRHFKALADGRCR